jgi:hypothetical protein
VNINHIYVFYGTEDQVLLGALSVDLINRLYSIFLQQSESALLPVGVLRALPPLSISAVAKMAADYVRTDDRGQVGRELDLG